MLWNSRLSKENVSWGRVNTGKYCLPFYQQQVKQLGGKCGALWFTSEPTFQHHIKIDFDWNLDSRSGPSISQPSICKIRLERVKAHISISNNEEANKETKFNLSLSGHTNLGKLKNAIKLLLRQKLLKNGSNNRIAELTMEGSLTYWYKKF